MKVTCSFRPKRKPVRSVSRIARMLAMAHQVERLIESGEVGSYSDAARALGLTRARMTQVMKLTLLSPEIQGRLLRGQRDATERALRCVVSEANWKKQLAVRAESSNS